MSSADTATAVRMSLNTPAGAVQRLTQDPGEPPAGFYRWREGPELLGDVETGDLIAFEGRWREIKHCTQVNGTVEVIASDDETIIAAGWDLPAILAHEGKAPARR